MGPGYFPLVLGGDHSLAYASIRGAAKSRTLGVIWVDAHADFNKPETTPSGNIHGMPLAVLAGRGDPRLVQLLDEAVPVVDPWRIAVIGARDLDPGEKVNLREAGVLCVYGSGFGTAPADGFFRVVYLASPDELSSIYDAVAEFTGRFLARG